IRLGRAGKPGKVVPHTLNSTAVATTRALVALVEQYQQADGTIEVPAVLRPYLDGQATLGGSRPAGAGSGG
ncbi:MAG TPA: serine--tRNA ligase, partial [Thermoplasmata archaeon]|nr:serine--tRNA ligase [Thermoplasmata archaeon]